MPTGALTILPAPQIGVDLQRQGSRCIDFTEELRGSLALFNLAQLAVHFAKLVAATTALVIYVVLIKAPQKPRRLLALASLPFVYMITLRLTDALIQNVLSYCY